MDFQLRLWLIGQSEWATGDVFVFFMPSCCNVESRICGFSNYLMPCGGEGTGGRLAVQCVVLEWMQAIDSLSQWGSLQHVERAGGQKLLSASLLVRSVRPTRARFLCRWQCCWGLEAGITSSRDWWQIKKELGPLIILAHPPNCFTANENVLRCSHSSNVGKWPLV